MDRQASYHGAWWEDKRQWEEVERVEVHPGDKESLFHHETSVGAGHTEMLCRLRPWKFSNSSWIKLCPMWSEILFLADWTAELRSLPAHAVPMMSTAFSDHNSADIYGARIFLPPKNHLNK